MKKLIIYFILLLFISTLIGIRATNADGLPIGLECESDSECESNQCENSAIIEPGKTLAFCVCGEFDTSVINPGGSPNCASAYGGVADDWTCKDGANLTWDLNYCLNKDIEKTEFAAGTKKSGTVSEILADMLLDSSAIVTDLYSEIDNIVKKPQPKITIPGLSFSEGKTVTEPDGNYLYIPFLGEYIGAIYKYLVIIASIIATAMIIKNAFDWAISAGDSTKITQAKTRIGQSLMGLVIAVGSYFILYTINPNLVEFKNLRVKYVERKELDTTATYLDMSDADTTTVGGETSALGVPMFKQYDYSNVPYGTVAGRSVMTSGCGPTALAMILKYYNLNTDPEKLATKIMENKNKYVGSNGTSYSVFTTEFLGQFGFKAESLGKNMEKIITHLKANHPVLAVVGTPSIFTKKGHFIVLTGVNENGSLFSVNDPNKRFYCTKEEINFPKYFKTYPKNLPKPPKDQQSFATACQQDGGQFILPNAIPAIEITNALKNSWFISKN